MMRLAMQKDDLIQKLEKKIESLIVENKRKGEKSV